MDAARVRMGPLVEESRMTDIKSLRQTTLNAATAARDAGMITPQQFARMTDGTVSMADVSLARDLVTRTVADPEAGALMGAARSTIAQNLHSAITQQNRAQSSATSIKEAVVDMLLGGANAEATRRVSDSLK
jgi:hypothetical protein